MREIWSGRGGGFATFRLLPTGVLVWVDKSVLFPLLILNATLPYSGRRRTVETRSGPVFDFSRSLRCRGLAGYGVSDEFGMINCLIC